MVYLEANKYMCQNDQGSSVWFPQDFRWVFIFVKQSGLSNSMNYGLDQTAKFRRVLKLCY